MNSRLLNEINNMKYLSNYEKGKVISEQQNDREIYEDNFVVSPYTLSATTDGDIKITDSSTSKSYVYSMSAYGIGVNVKDFPDGNSIEVSIPFKDNKTFNLPKDGTTASLIKQNVGKSKISTNIKGITVTLNCESGCVKPGGTTAPKTTLDKVSDTLKSAAGGVSNTLKSAAGGVSNTLKSTFGF